MAGFIALQQLGMSALQGGSLNGVAGGASLPQQQQPQSPGVGGGQGSRSFEEILQQNGSTPADGAGNGGAAQITETTRAPGVSGSDLERLRLDLTRRYSAVDPGPTQGGALSLSDMLEPRTRLQLLREAMSDGQHGGKNVDLHGRFGQLESEWYEVEKIMRSNKDLSQGELLGLQARLYQVSQHIEVMSKVVDQMTGGIKTILNTNV